MSEPDLTWMSSEMAVHGTERNPEHTLVLIAARILRREESRAGALFFRFVGGASVALGEGPFCEREGPFPRTLRFALELYVAAGMNRERYGEEFGRGAVRESVPSCGGRPTYRRAYLSGRSSGTRARRPRGASSTLGGT